MKLFTSSTTIIFMFVALCEMWGCKTVDPYVQLSQRRAELAEKESWRKTLPQPDRKVIKPAFPLVKNRKLKNGLEIFVVEDNRLPIAEIGMTFKHGSAQDPRGLFGINNLTAQMLKEGTKDLTALELAQAFANLGTELSVAVSKDMTQISSAVLSQKTDDVMKLMAQMVQEPRFDESDFQRVKLRHQNVLASYEAIPGYVAQVSFLRAAYGEKHPYAHPSAGTLKSIHAISLNDIKEVHQNNYAANQAALIAVGNVDIDQITVLAEKYFSHWSSKRTTRKKIPEPRTHKVMQTRLVARERSPQTYLIVGQPVVTQDPTELAAFEVLQSILTSGPSSRLDRNLREEKGWTYGVGSMVNPLLGKGPLLISSSIQAPFGTDALQEILSELDRLKNEAVTDDELYIAKFGLLHSYANRYSTIGRIAGYIANQFVYSLPSSCEEDLYNAIANVSKEKIQKLAKQLRKNNMTAVAVGEPEAINISMAKLNFGNVIVEEEQKTSP